MDQPSPEPAEDQPVVLDPGKKKRPPSRRDWRTALLGISLGLNVLIGAIVAYHLLWQSSPVAPQPDTQERTGLSPSELRPITPPDRPTPPAGEPRSEDRPPTRPAAAKKPPAGVTPSPTANPAPSATGSTLTVTAVGGSAAKGAIPAKVYIDDKLVGQAPLSSYPVQAGARRVRVDCLWEGKTYRGKDTPLEVPANTDAVIEHVCDVWVTLGR